MNISSTVRFDKNWELENGKKIRLLAFQKVAKTGNIGKTNPVAGGIDYIKYLAFRRLTGVAPTTIKLSMADKYQYNKGIRS